MARIPTFQQQRARYAPPKKPTVRRFDPFTPYVAPPIPAGAYDPALDAALGASNRGLGDLQFDIGQAGTREAVDYGIATGNLNRDRTQTFGDIQRGYDQTAAALEQQRTRGTEDYNRQLGLLQQSYQRLGNRQAQQFSASGLGSGGAALQAAAKRAANQAQDRQPLDTGYQRSIADIDLAKKQAGEQAFIAHGRLDQQTNDQLAQLALMSAPPDASTGFAGGRNAQDRAVQLLRAQREASQFGIDTTTQKAFQAGGVGYVEPGRGTPGGIPKNEFVGPKGNPYRVVRQGGYEYRIRPDGSVATKKRIR